MKFHLLYALAIFYIFLTSTSLAFKTRGTEGNFLDSTFLYLAMMVLLTSLLGDLSRYDKSIQTRLTELSDRIDCLSNRGKEDGDTNTITPGTDEE